MKKLLITLLFVLGISFIPSFLQAIPAEEKIYACAEDSVVFGRYINYMKNLDRMDFSATLMATASFFIGTPYTGGTLEKEPEGLVVNLRELDCFTFVETVIALSRMYHAGDSTFDSFCSQLKMLRYRDGKIGDYTSRLHYTSDWIYENEKKGLVGLFGKNEGGSPYAFNLSFMSTHPSSYRQLSANSNLVSIMSGIEKDISNRTNYYYFIKEDSIDYLAEKMQNGDVVAFLTTVKGLDISHVGIIAGRPDSLTFIHASSTGKKVMIHTSSLSDYVKKSSSCNGIMAARPLPPINGIFQRQISPLLPDSLTWRNLQKRLYRKYDSQFRILFQYKKATRVSKAD
jgi:cell wall-associated NlpC family hydrolase